MNRFLNRSAIALALSATLFLNAGCIGSFNLTTSLWRWNTNLGNKWISQFVFMGMCAIPAYGLMLFGDIFIFNVVEFYRGDHPVTGALEGDDTIAHRTLEQGDLRVELERRDLATGREMTVKVFRADVLEDAFTLRSSENGAAERLDADGNVVARGMVDRDGNLRFVDLRSGEVQVHTPASIQALVTSAG